MGISPKYSYLEQREGIIYLKTNAQIFPIFRGEGHEKGLLLFESQR